MSLSPLMNVPVRRQDSVIEVVRKTAVDGIVKDEAFVTTAITLEGDIADEEITLILPMTSGMGAQQVVRWVDDPVTEAIGFDDVDRSKLDRAVIEALKKMQESEDEKERAFLRAVEKAAQGFSQAVVKVEPGQRQLRFFYTFAVPKGEDGMPVLEVLAPLASFVIQPGGSISVVALLPAGTTVHEAVALQDPQNVNSTVPVDQATLGGRPCLGFAWQNDPLFRIRYA
jgi:hypothetical protein